MTDNTKITGVGAAKFDAGKVRVDLVPPEFTYATGAALTYGAMKYDEWNWGKGMRRGRIVAACMRHIMAYMMGQDNDPESGLPHSWHMAACVAMLIGMETRNVGVDDRQAVPGGWEKLEEKFNEMNDPNQTKARDCKEEGQVGAASAKPTKSESGWQQCLNIPAM